MASLSPARSSAPCHRSAVAVATAEEKAATAPAASGGHPGFSRSARRARSGALEPVEPHGKVHVSDATTDGVVERGVLGGRDVGVPVAASSAVRPPQQVVEEVPGEALTRIVESTCSSPGTRGPPEGRSAPPRRRVRAGSLSTRSRWAACCAGRCRPARTPAVREGGEEVETVRAALLARSRSDQCSGRG